MIINDLDGYYIVFDTKNWNTELDTLANKFINEEFERSNGTRVYFGEWHTHPENNPTSSSIDRKAIREIYKEARCPVGLVFFAIVGWVGIYWECFDGNSFVRITPIIV